MHIHLEHPVREFIGNDYRLMQSLHGAGDAISLSTVDPGRFSHGMTVEQFVALRDFVRAIEPEFEFAGVFSREVAKPDNVEVNEHGRERLVLSGELV